MRKSIFAIMLMFVLLQSMTARAVAESLIVETEYGPVRGKKAGEVYAFLGIPFAKPPLGDLRWRPPENPDHWISVLDADEFPPACPQKKFEMGEPDSLAEIIGVEDCLYLNVWTSGVEDALRPVLVFIHGGGNQAGSTSSFQAGARIYDGAALAHVGNQVVVTLQYRLGALGFLVHPSLAEESAESISGNYGLLDQILALNWIQNNIDRFGGDRRRVMLFGESGGAVDVSLLLTSPLAAGLFQRALIQSGAPVAKKYADAESLGIAYAQRRGCGNDGEKTINCLRHLPADSFVVDLEHPFENGVASQRWGGVVDGRVLPMQPLDALAAGNFNHVPLIVGSNADETSITVPAGITPAMTKAFFRLLVYGSSYDRLLALYPPGSANLQAREAFIQATTDAQFTAGARRIAREAALNQQEPVWRYFFSHSLSGISGRYGAYHGLELFFVFQTIDSTTYGRDGKLSAADRTVKRMMLKYWSHFAASGDPNGVGLVEWPEYDPQTDDYLNINASAFSSTDLRKEKCDFWDQIQQSATAVKRKPLHTVETFVLTQNYPNPFNPETTLSFVLVRPLRVKVTIHDVSGALVRVLWNDKLPAGRHKVRWNGTDTDGCPLASGLYFATLHTKMFRKTVKMTLLK